MDQEPVATRIEIKETQARGELQNKTNHFLFVNKANEKQTNRTFMSVISRRALKKGP